MEDGSPNNKQLMRRLPNNLKHVLMKKPRQGDEPSGLDDQLISLDGFGTDHVI